jgi:hypothetical protein
MENELKELENWLWPFLDKDCNHELVIEELQEKIYDIIAKAKAED